MTYCSSCQRYGDPMKEVISQGVNLPVFTQSLKTEAIYPSHGKVSRCFRHSSNRSTHSAATRTKASSSSVSPFSRRPRPCLWVPFTTTSTSRTISPWARLISLKWRSTSRRFLKSGINGNRNRTNNNSYRSFLSK